MGLLSFLVRKIALFKLKQASQRFRTFPSAKGNTRRLPQKCVMRLHQPKEGVNLFRGGALGLPSLFLRTTQIIFNFMLILKKMHTNEHAFKLATIKLSFEFCFVCF